MSLDVNTVHPATRSTSTSARVVVAVVSLAFVLVGCDGAVTVQEGWTANVAQQVASFVASFAQETLAALLL